MFLVSDTQAERHKKIKGFVSSKETTIAIFLAAADLEWTLRRAILAMGWSPNKSIREGVLKQCAGLDKYKDAWRKEVFPRFGKSLIDLVGNDNWSELSNKKHGAFVLRNRLIHGIAGTSGLDYSAQRVEVILAASIAIAKFSEGKGFNLFGKRLPVRLKPISLKK